MSQMSHPTADVFLLGIIGASSLVASLFFLRFWREAKDTLFLAFVAFFLFRGSCTLWSFFLRSERGERLAFLVARHVSPFGPRRDSLEKLRQELTH